MNPLMDELTFRNYAHQRMMFPEVQPERWAAIFQNVPAMEERFLKTFIAKLMQEIEVADQATGSAPVIDSLQVGGGGGEVPDGASPLQSSQVTALSLDYSGPFAEIPVIDQSLEARKLICGLSQGDTALMRVADTQEVASPPSLPEPLGREVSGIAEGRENDGQKMVRPGSHPSEPDKQSRSVRLSENQASPADQILEVALRQEQPAKAVNHVAGDWNPDLMRPENQLNSSLKAKTGVQSTVTDCASEIFSYFPLAEIVEKVFKQRSFLCN